MRLGRESISREEDLSRKEMPLDVLGIYFFEFSRLMSCANYAEKRWYSNLY